jgi:hypothetical protein
LSRAVEASGQEFDVKDFLPDLGLFFFQKIEQQRCQAGLLQDASHELVPGAEPAAAAAVGERYHPLGAWRDTQDAAQPPPAGRDFDLTFHPLRTGDHGTLTLSLKGLRPIRRGDLARLNLRVEPPRFNWSNGKPSTAE